MLPPNSGDKVAAAIEKVVNDEPPKSIKPPLGLLPKHIWEEQRVWDIAEAMERYRLAGKEIPQEWITEDNKLRNKNTP